MKFLNSLSPLWVASTPLLSLAAEMSAVMNSKAFVAFGDGVPVSLVTGEKILVKTKNVYRARRPVGFRFAKYSYVTELCTGSAPEIVGVGCGEAETRVIAFQKSVAEALERLVFAVLSKTELGTDTTNGWAAHLSQQKAFSSGLFELLERDAVLTHWLQTQPMVEISPESWPNWIKQWAQDELSSAPDFRHLRILVTTLGHVPSVTTIFQSEQTGHAIASHSASPRFENSIYSALAETCRVAQLAVQNKNAEHPAINPAESLMKGPERHLFQYAFKEPLPNWIFGPSVTYSEIAQLWRDRLSDFDPKYFKSKFQILATGPLVVGICSSPQVQNLFFGSTLRAQERGLINTERLTLVGDSKNLNHALHCVS